MKKLLILLLALVLMLAACGNSPTTADPIEESKGIQETSPTSETPETSDMFKIGIIQLVQHDALDDSRRGFIDGLAELGYIDGKNIIIDYQNAQGEIANANTIASKLVNDNNDLILAIATPAAQSVANATSTIPILFTSVTDPVDAGLVDSIEVPGGNITGTSDLAPIKDQIDLLVKFVPDAKVVGMLFCSNEANSYIQAAEAEKALKDLGIDYKEYTVSETNQIQQTVQTAVGQVDAIYTNTDNMIAAAMAQVSTIATENGIVVITGEQGQVEKGALATYGISYYNLGKQTAKQAAEILEGADPATMPVGFQTEFELSVNEETLNALGLTMPEGLE